MAVHYKLKAINFLGRDVPVVVQNENGPCPLIALANVLLLRNQIQLSVDYSEVSQERLLALIAGFLLDSNNPERLGTSDAELQANLQKNMGDAVEMLPKLTTGLDVNIFYHDIKGFEFTDVVAIFDLLDIHLVHGWLVDPQDKETVACIGNMSYNALIERLLSLAGSTSADNSAAPAADTTTATAATSIGAPDNAPEPPESDGLGSSSAAKAPPAADSAAGPAPMEASAAAEKSPADNNMRQELDLLGSEYDSDLQAALNLSLSQPAPETSSKPQDMQQPQPMAVDEPPQPTVILVAAPQPAPADADAEARNAAADGAALAEDYVVISHPKGSVLDEEMAEPDAAQETPEAATERAQEPPHKSDPAAEEQTPEAAADPSEKPPHKSNFAQEEVAAESQAADSTGAVQALEMIDSDGRVLGASTTAKAPEAAHLAAMLAGCAKEAFPAAPTEASGAAALQVTAGSAVGNAAGDASTVQEQAPSAGDPAPPPGGRAAPGDAHVIRAFLDNTSSQLTEHGLVSLHAGLKPNQLAVLFRNNHFNTLFKYEDALYILVTDLGYLHERQVVWEKLDAIDGDTVFVNSTLKLPEPVKARTPEEARTPTEQANADYALALQLHQEEQEAAERRRAAAAADGRAGDGQPPPAQTGQPGPPGPPAPSQQDTGGWGRAGHRHHGRHNRPRSGSRHTRPKREACNIM